MERGRIPVPVDRFSHLLWTLSGLAAVFVAFAVIGAVTRDDPVRQIIAMGYSDVGIFATNIYAFGLLLGFLRLTTIARARSPGFRWTALIGAVNGRIMALASGAFAIAPSRRGAWMPEFGGAGYHALVMVAWSLGYVVLSNGHVTGASSRPPALVENERSPAVQPDAATASDAAIVHHEGQLRIRDAGKVIYIDPSDVEMISADGDYVRVHVRGKRLLVRETLTRVAVALEGTEYVRIHRSTIVNARAISQVSRRPNSELLLVLRSGLQVRASRSFAPGLRDRLGVR